MSNNTSDTPKISINWNGIVLVPGKEFAPSVGMKWTSMQVALSRKTYPMLNERRVYIGRQVYFPSSLREEFLNSRLSANLTKAAS
jgi:hypothetical protein